VFISVCVFVCVCMYMQAEAKIEFSLDGPLLDWNVNKQGGIFEMLTN